MTGPNAPIRLSRPFVRPLGGVQTDDQYAASIVTQAFGPTSFAGEPAGFWYPDRSIDYYRNDGTATRVDHAHCGVDYGLRNAPLVAPADGHPVFMGKDGTGFGLCLILDHGPCRTLYGHLTRIEASLQFGVTVKAGAPIAVSGGGNGDWRDGSSTGPHLHWSVIDTATGRYYDPALYVFSKAPQPQPKPAPKVAPDPFHPGQFWVVTLRDRPTGCFRGPSEHSPKVDDIQPGTRVPCSGWMYGEQKGGDRRWYLTTDGWISGSRVTGGPPGVGPGVSS